MASITLTNTVQVNPGYKYEEGLCAVAIDAGQTAYLDTNVGKYRLGQANAQLTARIKGVAFNRTNGANQWLRVITEGTLTGLAGLVVGETYVQSDTVAGAVMPAADLTTADWVTWVGIALSATSLKLLPVIGDIQRA